MKLSLVITASASENPRKSTPGSGPRLRNGSTARRGLPLEGVFDIDRNNKKAPPQAMTTSAMINHIAPRLRRDDPPASDKATGGPTSEAASRGGSSNSNDGKEALCPAS